jgi:hypothetical protein
MKVAKANAVISDRSGETHGVTLRKGRRAMNLKIGW